MDTFLGTLLVLSVPMAVTIVVTALLCRHRIAHKRGVSKGTLVLGAFTAPLLTFLVCCLLDDGWDIFTIDYWTRAHGTLGSWLTLWCWACCVCLLPAAAVVTYYRRRRKKDEKSVA
jgi:hypothetical protein